MQKALICYINWLVQAMANQDKAPLSNSDRQFTFDIVSVNVNSMVSHDKRFTLLKFLESHKPAIIILCETKLNMRHKTQFSEYFIYRTDHPNADGGGGTTAIRERTLRT